MCERVSVYTWFFHIKSKLLTVRHTLVNSVLMVSKHNRYTNLLTLAIGPRVKDQCP
jgi:hypothetical protein